MADPTLVSSFGNKDCCPAEGPHCAMPRHANPYCAIPRHVTPSCAVPCHVVPAAHLTARQLISVHKCAQFCTSPQLRAPMAAGEMQAGSWESEEVVAGTSSGSKEQ